MYKSEKKIENIFYPKPTQYTLQKNHNLKIKLAIGMRMENDKWYSCMNREREKEKRN